MNKAQNVIVHYHLFKNAGSSIDHLLKFNFKEKWMTYDSDAANGVIPSVGLERLIVENPSSVAFSSHQILPPLPEFDGNLYPIVILRDPIDRARSAYLFEWKKQPGFDKPKGTFEEYIKDKFKNRRHNPIEEFQTIRLSNQFRDRFQNPAHVEDSELLEKAREFIESLSFVGIVDDFNRSVELLVKYLSPAFPNFKIKETKRNVLQDLSLTQHQKRELIREELSVEIYEELIYRNKLDEELYQIGRCRFEKLWRCSCVQHGLSK